MRFIRNTIIIFSYHYIFIYSYLIANNEYIITELISFSIHTCKTGHLESKTYLIIQLK